MLLALAVAALAGCPPKKPADDAPARAAGPEVEPEPGRLRALDSCKEKLAPTATLVPVKGAPVDVAIRRAYHLCMGEHVVLVRLRGKPGKRVVQVVLEQEIYDVYGRRKPHREVIPLARTLDPGTVRYHRLRWREGRTNQGERGLRLRVRAVDFADETRWSAPPWPPSPAVTPGNESPHGPKVIESVRGVRKSIQKITGSIRKQGQKLRKKKKEK